MDVAPRATGNTKYLWSETEAVVAFGQSCAFALFSDVGPLVNAGQFERISRGRVSLFLCSSFRLLLIRLSLYVCVCVCV